jgi:hypothetical protein
MTDKFGPGQADKQAAEQRTAQVAAENQAAKQPAEQGRQGEAPKTAAEKVQQSAESGDTATVDESVLVDPYPAYDEMSLDELRSAAGSRDVEINRDVEKAHLVSRLRAQEPHNPAYDLMPLKQLREKASGADAQMDEEFERAHLITELRAADTHTS